jgi:putative membrane protein insertion efficiency factor
VQWLFKKIIFFLIHAYRWIIGPFLKNSCQFHPTCSEYAIISIQYHGILRGLILAGKRILRCHPFKTFGSCPGFDPVPQPKKDSKN